MATLIPDETLDAILVTQLTIAWAGEGRCSPRRLGWWDTDLINEAGGRLLCSAASADARVGFARSCAGGTKGITGSSLMSIGKGGGAVAPDGAGAIRSIPLEDAARLLDTWWGDAPGGGISSRELTPDVLAERARKAGQDVIAEPILEWESHTDVEMLAELRRRAGPITGDLMIITEASFDPGVGAFLCSASELPALLEEHRRRFEPVFNGDFILALPAERRLVCVHHENHLIKIGSRSSP